MVKLMEKQLDFAGMTDAQARDAKPCYGVSFDLADEACMGECVLRDRCVSNVATVYAREVESQNGLDKGALSAVGGPYCTVAGLAENLELTPETAAVILDVIKGKPPSVLLKQFEPRSISPLVDAVGGTLPPPPPRMLPPPPPAAPPVAALPPSPAPGKKEPVKAKEKAPPKEKKAAPVTAVYTGNGLEFPDAPVPDCPEHGDKYGGKSADGKCHCIIVRKDEAKPPVWRVRDKVVLESGGPVMAVVAVGAKITCEWKDQDGVKKSHFRPETLRYHMEALGAAIARKERAAAKVTPPLLTGPNFLDQEEFGHASAEKKIPDELALSGKTEDSPAPEKEAPVKKPKAAKAPKAAPKKAQKAKKAPASKPANTPTTPYSAWSRERVRSPFVAGLKDKQVLNRPFQGHVYELTVDHPGNQYLVAVDKKAPKTFQTVYEATMHITGAHEYNAHVGKGKRTMSNWSAPKFWGSATKDAPVKMGGIARNPPPRSKKAPASKKAAPRKLPAKKAAKKQK